MRNYNFKNIWLLGLTVIFIALIISPNALGQPEEESSTLAAGMVVERAYVTEKGITFPFEEQKKEGFPEYAPSEVLVKFKEGADPQQVLQAANLTAEGIERIHSIKPAIARFKKEAKLEKDSEGWYWFFGKQYKEVGQIPDEEVFKEAYNQMKPEKKSLYRAYKIKLPEGMSVEAAVAALEANPGVEYAEPNYKAEAFMVPNDPYYSSSGSWGQAYDDLWGLKLGRLNCAAAWDISQGEGAVVAVIDTGVDYNHEDIAGNMWVNQDEIPGNGIDDDGNGYIDDVHGYDFVNNDSDPLDDHGHGTHCAGTIAAVGNNGRGVIGVAPRAKIMAVKGLGSDGSGYIDGLAACVRYAGDNGIKVLSNSWGGFGSNQTLIDAFHYAHSEGCVAIAAAGNSNSDVSGFTPANIDTVIAVAATDNNDQKASFSNYGAKIDVAAPGVDILSLRATGTDMYGDGSHIVGSRYYRASGTSMACPHVAGVAALIVSRHSEFTPREIEYILRYATNPIAQDQPLGTGRINAYSAVQVETPPPIAWFELPDMIRGRVDINGEAYGGGFREYVLEYAPEGFPSSWNEFYRSSTSTQTMLVSGWDTSNISKICSGRYIIRLSVYGAADMVSMYQLTTRIENLALSMPIGNDVLRHGQILNIKGTVLMDPATYELDYGLGNDPQSWSNSGIALLNGGNGGVSDVVLAEWDTRMLIPNQFYTLRLKVHFPDSSECSIFSRMIYFDPRLRSGWPVYIQGVSREVSQLVYPVDLNNDGNQEIVTSVSDEQLSRLNVYRLDGSLLWSREFGAGQLEHGEVIAADLDGNGYKELYVDHAILERYIVDEVFYGFDHNGNDLPGWPITNIYYGRASVWCAFKSAVDVDGDGREELVVTARDALEIDPLVWGQQMRPVFVIKSGGVAGPIIKWYYIVGNIGTGNFSNLGPAFGNFDDDPAMEMVAWCNTNKEIGVFDIEGDNRTRLSPKWTFKPENIQWESGSPLVGDVNNDEQDEIVLTVIESINWISTKSTTYVLNRNGQILPGWPVSTEVDWGKRIPALGDLDGDKDLEICIPARIVGKQYVFHHNGTIASGWPQIYFRDLYAATGWENIIGDINGDGRPDILLVEGGITREAVNSGDCSGCRGVMAWNADGTEIDLNPDADSKAIFIEGMCNPGYALDGGSPVLTDLDGNGRIDIIIATSIGDLRLPFGNEEYLDKGRESIYAWELDVPYSTLTMEWPVYKGNFAYTGRYIPPNRIVPPAAPTNLRAMAVSLTQVNLRWRDNSNNETGFKIERKTGISGTYVQIDTRGANNTNNATYNDTSGLGSSTTYYYRVRSTNIGGDSGYSNEISVTTPPSAPSAPTNLTATAVSGIQIINLSWTDNSSNEAGFKLERKTGAGGSYAQIAAPAANVTRYSDIGLTPGTTYYYRIKATNAVGDSAYSNVASATSWQNPPAAPTNLVGTAVSPTQINLSWTDNSSDETGFKIERKTGSTGTYNQIATPGANATSYTDKGLYPGTTYYYRIRTTSAAGDSGYSNEASAMLPGAIYRAQFISQSVPATMVVGTSYTVSLTVKNTGNTLWTKADGYQLGSLSPADQTAWGLNRVLLSDADSIAPGQTKAFTFTVTAPRTPGNYNFHWRMLKEGGALVYHLGNSSNVVVKVK